MSALRLLQEMHAGPGRSHVVPTGGEQGPSDPCGRVHGGGSGVWKLLPRRQEGPRAPPEPGTGRARSARSPWGRGLANTATAARDTNSRLWVGTVRGRIWAI